MMYVRFPLSLPNFEDLQHERGIEISHETVRFWWNRFGPMFAAEIRKKRIHQLRAHSPKLFYRTTWKVTITDAGQIYYNHCRQALEGLAEVERAISDLHQTPKGKLNLTAPVAYGENRIAPLVNDFVDRYPELEINLTLTNKMLDLVAESYDLTIRLS
jgi:hypothetical protein